MERLQAKLYKLICMFLSQHSNLNLQYLLRGELEKKYLHKAGTHVCGQVNMHPRPPRHPQAHTCCRVYGSDTKAVSNRSRLPEQAKHQPRTPHLPSSKGVPSGLEEEKQSTALPRWQPDSNPPAAERPPRPPPPSLSTHPKMTAFHTMMLFSEGAPLTPAGGSSCSLRAQGR